MHELTPILQKEVKEPLYIQLTNYLKQEIINGKLPLNEKLPSKRKFALHLQVSFNTVQAAYDQLVAEGFIESAPRKGYFVSLHLEENIIKQVADEQLAQIQDSDPPICIDFSSGRVDSDQFPLNAWRKLSIQSIMESQKDWLHNGEPQGDVSLRKEIATYLYSSRGVNCNANSIVIGAGTQVLMALIGQLMGRDKRYAFENPGFHRTRRVIEDLGADTIPISLDEHGVRVEELYKSKADVLYVTPSHQFPFGMIMPINRRMELLEWAGENNSYIIEDDYDGEFRYKGKPIPALFSWNNSDRVIYLGTFSKSLIPSVRISYMVLPNNLVSIYKKYFTIYKQTVSRQQQDTLARFMKEGYYNSHLNKMRTLYRKKRHTLLQAIVSYFGEKVEVIGENSGLHIVLEIKTNKKEEELIIESECVGVKVYPLSIYYFHGEKSLFPQVLLGYGGLSVHEIEGGIKLLHKAWFPSC